jgi:8-oxo-dGTP diphosphatase
MPRAARKSKLRQSRFCHRASLYYDSSNRDSGFEIATRTGHRMARAPVLAAGGIVLRRQQPPLIAVVRLRKRDEWVLPKGRLDAGETPRAAAMREVLEETGHDVSVHEFLGTLVYESGGRSRIVHYWRMETSGGQVYELMDDIRAVDWLPLQAAVERLSRGHERAFLENVGPIALQAAAFDRAQRRAKARQQSLPAKRRSRPVAAPRPAPTVEAPVAAPPVSTLVELVSDASQIVPGDVSEGTISLDGAESAVSPPAFSIDPVTAETMPAPADPVVAPMAPPTGGEEMAAPGSRWRQNLMQQVRAWLRGVAASSA